MKVVWKYEIPKDDFTVEMLVGAEVVSVQMQREAPCFWALVDSDAPAERRHFRMFGTGHKIPSDLSLKYIGTFQVEAVLVFHLFEVTL